MADLIIKEFGGLEHVFRTVHDIACGKVVAGKRPSHAAMLQAAEILANRVYGRPVQALEHSGPEGEPLVVRVTRYAEQAALAPVDASTTATGGVKPALANDEPEGA